MMANSSSDPLALVLVPGLNCSARLYAEQVPALWQFGPVTIADHRRDDSMAALARRILVNAPQRFALAGLSMGGYIAFEIVRQAADRVAKLALLDTGARAEVPERTNARRPLMALARQGRIGEITDDQFPLLVHHKRHGDQALKAIVRAMNQETGAEAYIRQQEAIIHGPRLRRSTARRSSSSAMRISSRRPNWRGKWPTASAGRGSSSSPKADTSRRSNNRRR